MTIKSIGKTFYLYSLSLVFFALTSYRSHAELDGQPCDQLDQQDGFLTDGYSYWDWHCEDLALSDVAGTDFMVRLRWNRPALENRATAIWIGSGNGTRPYADVDTGIADSSDPRSIRTRLDEDEQIRSIEVQFLNPVEEGSPGETSGGYWAAPRQGYFKAATAFQQVVDFLHQQDVDLVQGDWLIQVGSSNGATILAFTLAYLDANRYQSHMIFLSGPFGVDLLKECRDSSFEAYTGVNDGEPDVLSGSEIRRMLSAWNGWEDCADMWFIDFRRSLLGFLARRSFPDTEIDVIVSSRDGFGPWLLHSNAHWYDAISAYRKGRIEDSSLPHEVIGGQFGNDTTIYNVIRRVPEAIMSNLSTSAP